MNGSKNCVLFGSMISIALLFSCNSKIKTTASTDFAKNNSFDSSLNSSWWGKDEYSNFIRSAFNENPDESEVIQIDDSISNKAQILGFLTGNDFYKNRLTLHFASACVIFRKTSEMENKNRKYKGDIVDEVVSYESSNDSSTIQKVEIEYYDATKCEIVARVRIFDRTGNILIDRSGVKYPFKPNPDCIQSAEQAGANDNDTTTVSRSSNSNVANTSNSNLTNNSKSYTPVSFDDDQSVYSYLEGKTFYSSNHSVKVKISNIVYINGQDAYYNLTIRRINSNMGVVKGQSMNNPNGTITIYVYPQTGCIKNAGDEYCLSN